MIVLAIGGMIIAIVLMTAASLQRISRNTQRKNDASFISSERIQYDIDNNTTFPSSPVTATCTAVGGSFSTLCTYLVKYVSFYEPQNITMINNGTSPATSVPTVTPNTIVSATYLVCNGNTATTVGAHMADTVVIYALEDGKGGQTNQCIQTGVTRSN